MFLQTLVTEEIIAATWIITGSFLKSSWICELTQVWDDDSITETQAGLCPLHLHDFLFFSPIKKYLRGPTVYFSRRYS